VFSDQVYTHDVHVLGTQDFSIILRAQYPCLGLLLASRQVYHETALLPYNLATFVFLLRYRLFPSEAQAFLAKRSEAQLAAIGQMTIMYCGGTLHGTGANLFEKLHCDDILSGKCRNDWYNAMICK